MCNLVIELDLSLNALKLHEPPRHRRKTDFCDALITRCLKEPRELFNLTALKPCAHLAEVLSKRTIMQKLVTVLGSLVPTASLLLFELSRDSEFQKLTDLPRGARQARHGTWLDLGH